MRIKRFNLAALLNFLNVVKSNESNPDEVFRKKKYPRSYRRLFLHVSEEKVFLSHITSPMDMEIATMSNWL